MLAPHDTEPFELPDDEPAGINNKDEWLRFCRDRDQLSLRPERLTAAQRADLTPRERAVYDQQRKVWHARFGPLSVPALTYISEQLWRVIETNMLSGSPHAHPSAALDADGTLGKTTIITECARYADRKVRQMYPVRSRRDDRTPSVYITLRSSASVKSVNRSIASFYGLPHAPGRSSEDFEYAVAECARRCRTVVLCIDDFHQVKSRSRDHTLVSGYIKHLQNVLPVTVILAGIDILDQLDDGHGPGKRRLSQTGGRFSVYTLTRYGRTTQDEQHDWKELVANFSSHLVLEHGAGDLVARAKYLHTRSGGSIGSLSRLLRHAANTAISTDGPEKLDRWLLDSIRLDKIAEEYARSHGWKPSPGSRSIPPRRPR